MCEELNVIMYGSMSSLRIMWYYAVTNIEAIMNDGEVVENVLENGADSICKSVGVESLLG